MKHLSLTSAIIVAGAIACGDGEPQNANALHASDSRDVAAQSSTIPTGIISRPAAARTWDVKMLGDASGYRFDPVSLSINRGDAVRWTVVSGPPNNVAFWVDSIPTGAGPALQAATTRSPASFIGPLLLAVNESYTISFAEVPPGVYRYYSTPYLSRGMVGKVIVR